MLVFFSIQFPIFGTENEGIFIIRVHLQNDNNGTAASGGRWMNNGYIHSDEIQDEAKL